MTAMHFSVFALASVADVATTRRLYALDDLDDKAVSKVLFHQRKQQTGSSEALRWDQRMLVGISVIEYDSAGLRVTSCDFSTGEERTMLDAYYAAAARNPRVVCWDGRDLDRPLLHFRSLMHRVSAPAYWNAAGGAAASHVDIRASLAPPGDDLPSLDVTARKLGYPGMLGRDDDDVHTAWLRREPEAVRAYVEVAALNTFLLTLRLFSMTGEIDADAAREAEDSVRAWLHQRAQTHHLAAFLDAWRDA